MTLVYADRVLETSSTTGTGAINLLGATAGFQTFVQGAGDGSKVAYFMEDGQNWEAGVGTVTAGSPDTLSRDSVMDSSAGGSPINWGPGVRNVYISASANFLIWKNEDGEFNDPDIIGTGNLKNGAVTPAKMAGGQFVLAVARKQCPDIMIIAGDVLQLDPQYNEFVIDTEGSAALDDLKWVRDLDGNEWPENSTIYLRTAENARDVTIVADGGAGAGRIFARRGVAFTLHGQGDMARLTKWGGTNPGWLATPEFQNTTSTQAEERRSLGINAAADTLLAAANVGAQQTALGIGALGLLDTPPVYTGTSNSNLTYPVGDYVLLQDGATSVRNATIVPTLNAANTTYTIAGAGSPLSGVWRHRGRPTSDGSLAQRTS